MHLSSSVITYVPPEIVQRLLSKEKRVKERAEWRELQIIIRGYRALGFDYVIKRLPPAKICFGSSLDRKVLPFNSSHMSPLMRRITPKLAYIDRKRSVSSMKKQTIDNAKDGYGPLASKVARFSDKTSSNTAKTLYHPGDQAKPIKKCRQPFGRSMKELTFTSITPGPGTYVAHGRKYIFQHSFGGRRRPIPAVDTVCSAVPFARCEDCGEMPKGDYWQNWTTSKVLCRPCMTEEVEKATFHSKSKVTKYRRLNELNRYTRARHCGYYHDHQGTTASVKLMTPKELRTKYRRENYLSMFNM